MNAQGRISLPFRSTANLYNEMWASPFPGGMHMAQHILDNPILVQDRVVIDIGSGCGVVAIACAIAGARRVEAWDRDENAMDVIACNATHNGVSDVITPRPTALVSPDQFDGFDGVICAADLFYEESTDNESLLMRADPQCGVLVASFDSELAQFRKAGAQNFSALPSSSQPELYVRMFYRPSVESVIQGLKLST